MNIQLIEKMVFKMRFPTTPFSENQQNIPIKPLNLFMTTAQKKKSTNWCSLLQKKTQLIQEKKQREIRLCVYQGEIRQAELVPQDFLNRGTIVLKIRYELVVKYQTCLSTSIYY